MAGEAWDGGSAADGVGSVAAGRVVAGVRLRELIGRGAGGQVWAGTDLDDGCRVAVKLLDGPPAVVDVALAQGLRHPHVLPVRRVEHDPPAVVMPLAGGGSLAAQVAARGCLRPGEVVTVVAPLADALAWLHARGVVHGDVSATNVLFVERGRPVLSDLGSSRLAGAGRPVATPGFAAPEVVAGAVATPASDVHGLAAIGWLALTGSAPAEAEDRLPLRLLVPECPDALVDVVLRGLDPDPAVRPTPSELAAAVRTAAETEPVGLVPSAALGVRADEAVTYRVREAARRDRPARRRRGREARLRLPVAMVAAVLVVLALALGAATVGRSLLPLGPASHVDGEASGEPALPEVVTTLVSERQAALRSGDAGRLADVHHPAGTTLAADVALLADGPVDVSYRVVEVDEVEAVADGPAAAGPALAQESWRASVRMTTVLGPRETVGGDTVEEQVVEEDVVVELARHEGRWLVHRVTG